MLLPCRPVPFSQKQSKTRAWSKKLCRKLGLGRENYLWKRHIVLPFGVTAAQACFLLSHLTSTDTCIIVWLLSATCSTGHFDSCSWEVRNIVESASLEATNAAQSHELHFVIYALQKSQNRLLPHNHSQLFFLLHLVWCTKAISNLKYRS